MRAKLVLGPATILLAGLGIATAEPGHEGIPERIARIPVTLRFDDQPVARVLEGLFAAGQVRVDVDPCVSGRVSIALENATLGSVLEELTRLADLEIDTADSERIRVACHEGRVSEAPRERAFRERPLTLTFRITRESPGGAETPLLARLAVSPGAVAETSGAEGIPGWAITEDGEVSQSRRPDWTLKAVVVPAEHGLGREIRGILEVARSLPSSSTRGRTTVTSSTFFAASTSTFDGADLAVLEVGESTWVLQGESLD